jgi:hypothetical protein
MQRDSLWRDGNDGVQILAGLGEKVLGLAMWNDTDIEIRHRSGINELESLARTVQFVESCAHAGVQPRKKLRNTGAGVPGNDQTQLRDRAATV